MIKDILFLTGTRADFGKLKPLMNAVDSEENFRCHVFVTGMHLLAKYGNTINEIHKSGFKNVFTYMNQIDGEDMEEILANTIIGLRRYLHENKIDLIVVHGDRVEALAGATVGALRNILVAHIEGGEISGTVDELMRHAISKLSHIHFVANEKAENRLKQLGESPESIFEIGSPDVDIMLSNNLPSFSQVQQRYSIPFEQYGVVMLHPVTTEYHEQQIHNAKVFVDVLIESEKNFVVIFPNNDKGSDLILREYDRLKNIERIKMFPSIRFEYFLTLLKESLYLVGNSSAGIHEAPIYGIPTINIGSRQKNRFSYESIFDIPFDKNELSKIMDRFSKRTRFKPCEYYGDGNSSKKFIQKIKNDIWNISNQKQFRDIN